MDVFIKAANTVYPEKRIEGSGLYVDNPETGKTFMLLISDADRDEFDALPPGATDQTVKVEDQITETWHEVRRGRCGLGCFCGAEFV